MVTKFETLAILVAKIKFLHTLQILKCHGIFVFQIFEGEQLPLEPDLFEMFISPELEYPLVCLGVRIGDEKNPLKFDILNLNSGSSWFIDLESLKGL